MMIVELRSLCGTTPRNTYLSETYEYMTYMNALSSISYVEFVGINETEILINCSSEYIPPNNPGVLIGSYVVHK